MEGVAQGGLRVFTGVGAVLAGRVLAAAGLGSGADGGEQVVQHGLADRAGQGDLGEPRVFRTVRYWPISGGDLAVQVLVVDLVWGLVGECRVESFRIVSEFDVSRNVVDGVPAGRILGTMDPLVLQDGEE